VIATRRRYQTESWTLLSIHNGRKWAKTVQYWIVGTNVDGVEFEVLDRTAVITER